MASTNKTEHLQLNQWVGTDPFRMADFNEDNQKIDAALKANADAIANTTQALAAVQSSALKIATGSYTGTGTMGSSNKKTLSFDFEPKLVIVRSPSASGSAGVVYGLTLVRGATVQYADTYGTYGTSLNVAWGSNSVSWYRADGVPADQCNEKNTKYYYIAIG